MLQSRRLIWLALILLAALPLFGVDRSAFTFTRYDLKASLRPDQHALDVEGTIEVRNDSAAPQSSIPLQISSSLTWLRVSIGDEQPSWISQTYTSDIDHTGALSEAIITLVKPLAPKSSLKIAVHYAGTVDRDSTRLTRIGTPQDVAERSDWDRISEKSTALRGLGYVTWYPVSIDAVSLSNGDEVFDAIAAWKQRHREFKLRALIGITTGQGESPLKLVTNAQPTAADTSQSSNAQYEFALDGTPTLVVGNLAAIDRQHLTVYVAPEHTSLARDYVIAAEKAQTTIAAWFGEPHQKAVIVELADEEALPFEIGPYLFTPLKNVPPLAPEVALARTLAHASFDSPRPWVREGLAGFAQSLVREQQQGHKAGLAYLNQFVNALAVAESQTQSTAKSDESSSKTQLPSIGPQPLLSTNDELFYRTKAAFVWSMLRDMLGDDAIKTFISRYRAADDKDGSYVQHLLESAGSSHRDLEQFFDDWVYRDRGLPELRIASAFPRELVQQAGNSKPNYVVAVTVENTGSAWVEIPVVVRTGHDERSVRVAVPARSKAVARVPFPAVPDEVIVNDGSVPEADVTDNRFTLPNATDQQRK
jgi:hypothetical protein